MTSPQSRTKTPSAGDLPPRSQWQVCLAAVERANIKVLVDELSKQYTVRSIKPASTGLGMLQLRDSVHHDGFHAGEFTISTALVQLTDATGGSIEGGAVIMRDDEWLATALAILDGVLSARWRGCERAAALVLEGQQLLSHVAAERRAILAKTVVDFSTLDEDA